MYFQKKGDDEMEELKNKAKVEPLSLAEKLAATVFVLIAFYFTIIGDWNFAFFTLLMTIILFMWVITKWLCFIAELLFKE